MGNLTAGESSYPNEIDVYRALINGQGGDEYVAEHINGLAAGLTNVQKELGLNVRGSAADLKARLASILNEDGTLKSNLFARAAGAYLTYGGGVYTVHANVSSCGRLVFVNATQLKYQQYNGAVVVAGRNDGIDEHHSWLIPDAGVTAGNTGVYVDGVAAQNLAADATYLVTVFANSGVLTLDFRTNLAHTPISQVGVECPNPGGTPLKTRTVVGLIRTNASSQFESGLVRSWANRAPLILSKFLTSQQDVTTTGFSEISTSLRAPFVCWADDAVVVVSGGLSWMDNASNWAEVAVAFDGVSAEEPTGVLQGTLRQTPVAHSVKALGDGYHYATLLAKVNAGTASFWGFASGTGRVGLTGHIGV